LQYSLKDLIRNHNDWDDLDFHRFPLPPLGHPQLFHFVDFPKEKQHF
jgi:hypothetical protein